MSGMLRCGLGICCSVVAGVFLAGTAAASEPQPATRLINKHVEYVLGRDGCTQHVFDRRTGTDYAPAKSKSPLARVKKQGREYAASELSYDDGSLSMKFGALGVSAVIAVTAKPSYFIFEVKQLQGDGVEEFTFVDIPLATRGLPDEPFAACALALNLQTKVPELPQAVSRLRALCYPRFGFAGAKVALLGCPTGELRSLMKEVVAEAPELPQSRIGGPWALDAPENFGSYLMTSGLTEKEVGDWIGLAQSLGMSQIDFHGGHCFRFGDCEPNAKMYPEGRASLKAVIDKLHAAGIKAGLHTYAFFIAKNCPWVTPVPDPRLAKDAVFTLTDGLSASAAVVPVAESTQNMSSVTGFFVRNSATVQIDDELITYAGVAKEPPYAFTQCRRGAYGTRAAAHAKGARVHHLRECFGLFVPDGDSTLLTEVAAKTAELYNECGFDMIYLDALDGEDVIAGHENGWHYGSKFTFEIARRLNKPALFEMSTFHHHLWYVRARMGAWDHPTRSHKRFIDIHCQSNESCRRMFLPANLGWWSFMTWSGTQGEPTFSDDIEYWCAKALGNGASLELSISPGQMAQTPAFPRLAAIVKQYEMLRRGNYFGEDVKRALRAAGEDFTLTQNAAGAWEFRRTQIEKHRSDRWGPENGSGPFSAEHPAGRSGKRVLTPFSAGTDRWTFTNKYARQPLQLRIQTLLSAGPYDAPGSIDLAKFTDPQELPERAAPGSIKAALEPSAEQIKVGPSSGRYTATNPGGARQGAWSKIGRTFAPPINLAKHQALGLWVHGDGKGEVLNLQLRSPAHLSHGIGDHYILVDFQGWRYFELIEPEGERHANYVWPYGGAYAIYRESVYYANVESLNLFYNNLPPKETATCYLSPIRALPTVAAKLRNPAVSVGGKRIVFPVEIESGSYLEFRSLTDCKLYGPKGELLADVRPQGEVPVLEPGDNHVALQCDLPAGPTPRAHVWLFTQGDALPGR